MSEPDSSPVAHPSALPAKPASPALLFLDTTGRITAANTAARELWQAAEVELIGEHFANLFFFEIVSQKPDWLETEWDVLLAATTEKTIVLKAQPREGAPRDVRVHLESALGSSAGYFATVERGNATTGPVDPRFSALAPLADKGAIGFFDLDLKEKRVYYSSTWKRILGYADEELPNTYDTWLQLIHPDDSAAAPDKIGKKKVVGLRPFSLEFRMKHRAGHFIWLQSTGLQIIDDDGILERVIGTHLDIGDRKELEETGLASDDRLKALAHDSGPLAAFEIDFAAQHAWYSGAWKHVLGYDPGDLEGPNAMLGLLPTEDGAVDLVDFFLSRALGHESFVEACHLCHKEGRFIPVVLGAHCQLNRRRELVRVVGFCCLLTPDASAYTGSESDPLPDALLDATFSALAEGVVVTNGRSEVLYLNSAASRLLGVSARTAANRPLREIFRLVNLTDGQPDPDPVQSVLNGDKPIPLIDGHALLSAESSESGMLLTKEEKSPRPIVWTARAAIDANGRPLGAVIVFRDPEEMNLTPDELVKVSRFESLGFIASGLAQEFNQHLASILGAVSLAKHGNAFALDDAEKSCLAAQELTRKLVAFAKGGTGARSLCSAKDLLDDAVALAAAGESAKVTVTVAENVDAVMVERTQVAQVIQNLIINALQAMPPPPHPACIQLSAANAVLAPEQVPPLSAGPYVTFEVRDNGNGILPEHLEKIWERFFTTRKHGTGLGLATALSIVTKHGGQIGMDSTPGVGSAFTVFLPAADGRPAISANPAKSPRFRTGRVLFMDDDPKISELAANMLQGLDYKFDLARNGEDALSLYRRYFSIGRPHDVVILDLTIPDGMGGEECFKALREIDPGIRAIVSSGHNHDATTQRFLDMGFCGYLAKPYRVSDLGKMLKTVTG